MDTTMDSLTHARCFNHAEREAAARCPECKRFFCRECVTEHGDRVICARCLRRLAELGRRADGRIAKLHTVSHLALAFLVAWLVFYSFGRALLLLPTSFHEGTLWRELAWEIP